jgi:hypothetical protein
MTRPEFEREMARLRESIAALPADQRESLERLAQETIERHAEISQSSLRGARALERLELAYDGLRNACTRLLALAEEARDALARSRSLPPPEPGLN